MTPAEIRALLRGNITNVVAVFDAHDPGVIDGAHECPCGHKGTAAEWEQHLADKLGDLLAAHGAEQLVLT